jgi:two-component system, LytTR family, response regulator
MKQSPAAQFLLHTNKGAEVIDCNTLVRIEAVSNYSKLIFSNGKSIITAQLLAKFESMLAGFGFVRMHRSHLINMRFITSCSSAKNMQVRLMNNEQLAVSKRKKAAFKSAVQQFFAVAA